LNVSILNLQRFQILKDQTFPTRTTHFLYSVKMLYSDKIDISKFTTVIKQRQLRCRAVVRPPLEWKIGL